MAAVGWSADRMFPRRGSQKEARVELCEIYGDLGASLPTSSDGDTVVFTGDTVPRPPDVLETPHLVVRRGLHQMTASVLVDKVYLYAEPAEYRQLGLLCLGVLLHDVDVVDLQLTSPRTEIGTIRVACRWASVDTALRLVRRPLAFGYSVHDPDDDEGWLGWGEDSCLFIELTNASETWSVGRPEPKTHLIGFGGEQQLAFAAQIFLDMGAAQQRTQFDFIQPEGVTNHSAELRVLLPGDQLYLKGEDPTKSHRY